MRRPNPRHRVRPVWAAALLAAALGGASTDAAGEGPQQPSDSGADAFSVLDVDGRTTTGALVDIDPERVVLATPERREIAADRIVRLERPGRTGPASESSPCVLLANGDRLALRVIEMTDDALRAAWAAYPALAEVKLPLETVRGLVVSPPENADGRFAVERLLADRRDENDLLLLSRGDRLTGELLSWKADTLTLKGPAGEAALKRGQVLGVGFNSSLTSFPKSDGLRQLVRLTDGSQITVRGVALHGGTLSAEAVFGAALEWPLSAVASVRFLGGAVLPLSDLPTQAYRHTPFVSGEWKLGLDRTASGRPLRLRGAAHPKGLGMHSRSEARYDLEGKCRTFFATAGIDDETLGQGNAVFAVEVDGQRVFASPPQTGGSPPLAIGPIDVTGKKTLTLIVDFGQLGDVQDHADWCDPVLVRER